MAGRSRGLVAALLSLALIVGMVTVTPCSASQDPGDMPQDPGYDDGSMDNPNGNRAAAKKKGARTKKGAAKSKAAAKGRTKGAAKPDDAEPSADAPAISAAASSDGPLFSRDVAPVLVSLCTGCHEPKQLRGKLDLTTFEALMKGSSAEPVIVPGKPEESHLLLRIKGEETPKMPPNGQRTVGEAAIAKIEQWIKAGALLDKGRDPKAQIASYAASADQIKKMETAKLPADQRDKKTIEAGLERWKKANPKITPEVSPGKRFIYFGVTPKDRVPGALKTLETQLSVLGGWFGDDVIQSDEKFSVYVFNDAGSFGEFVKNNEQRDIEPGDQASAQLGIPNPYLAVIDPAGGREEVKRAATKKGARTKKDASEGDGQDRTLGGVLTEQLGIGIANRAGKAPRWVSLGLGAFLAQKVEPRSSYYSSIKQEAHDLMEQGWASKASDALGDATKVEDVRAVGFAIIEWLSSTDKDLAVAFVKAMLGGQEKLDDAIAEVLNGRREEFLGGSAEFIEETYSGSR